MTLDSFTYSALLILSLIMISTLERKLKVCKDLYLNTSQAWKLPKGKTICAFQACSPFLHFSNTFFRPQAVVGLLRMDGLF